MEKILIIVVVSVFIAAILFLVLREVVTWYFKINKLVEQNDEIIRLLEVIAYEQDDEPIKELELEVIKNKNDITTALFSKRT
ncbi:MAG TPA: hypothetical protein DCR40_18125 [Prolixibacteraceae bacterium]|nr:hypothetical protein [Prolixibacteraceae bacterium]